MPDSPIQPQRDQVADERDKAATAEDSAADQRDERAVAREDRAERRERRAARDMAAEFDRDEALRDRQAAARDREAASTDRDAAAHDRQVAAMDRSASSIDELTGTYRREHGLATLDLETTSAAQSQQPFVIAFVDVDRLKETNDRYGHAAGDRLLRLTVAAIRANLRADDLIMRFGGDEFLCGLPGMSSDEADRRFVAVNRDLAPHHASVTVGLAELGPHESLEDLIARADDAMYRRRGICRSAKIEARAGPGAADLEERRKVDRRVTADRRAGAAG